ncbi:MAG: hypothetical protein HC902_02025 [Calothrix sp. SM1_5_4]|nr:hypothetical protein [Calothrix sp. SM1_5_4]
MAQLNEPSIESEIDAELMMEDDGGADEIEPEMSIQSTPEVVDGFTDRPSPPSGEPIFDWSKHKGEKEVPHPFAEKGLIRIAKDRTYIYRVDESEQSRAASFRIGVFNPVNLENPDMAGQEGASFEENYDQTDNPSVMIDYEWQSWRSPLGKIGLRAGAGIYVAQGHGHFVSGINSGLEPRELFTFVAVPLSLGAVYRMHVWHRQLFVPYAEGGGIAFAFSELRDDDKPPKFGGAPAGYYAGGLALNLSYFDKLARIQLDREYGINAVYLTVEYRGVVALSEKFDFSSDLYNAGFLMEF